MHDIRRLVLPYVLIYGLMIGLISIGIFHYFYSAGIVWALPTAGTVMFLLGGLSFAILISVAIVHMRRSAKLALSFRQILAISLSTAFVAGLVSMAYDYYFYTQVEPNYPLKVQENVVAMADSLVAIGALEQEVYEENIALTKQRLAEERAHPTPAWRLAVYRLRDMAIFGFIYGMILGFLLRDRVPRTAQQRVSYDPRYERPPEPPATEG